MKKKVAVLAVDPVNGAGLFQYLESFYVLIKCLPYPIIKIYVQTPELLY